MSSGVTLVHTRNDIEGDDRQCLLCVVCVSDDVLAALHIKFSFQFSKILGLSSPFKDLETEETCPRHRAGRQGFACKSDVQFALCMHSVLPRYLQEKLVPGPPADAKIHRRSSP